MTEEFLVLITLKETKKYTCPFFWEDNLPDKAHFIKND
jgi:hypothetical protein